MTELEMFAIARRIERAAARRGYSGDPFVEAERGTGTLREQFAMADVWIDARPGRLSSAAAEVVRQFVRNCVLGEQQHSPATPPPPPAKNRGGRKW